MTASRDTRETAGVTAAYPPDLDEFYAAGYPRIVGMLVLLTGNRAEAEEIAQEAFIRLIPRWETVRRYDDPLAWVRTTARRLATSRWRRAKVAARALPLLGAAQRGARPDCDLSPEVADWLRGLSAQHREVLVLHYALQMPIEEIATELGVAPGTVKSRLSRARQAARTLPEEH